MSADPAFDHNPSRAPGSAGTPALLWVVVGVLAVAAVLGGLALGGFFSGSAVDPNAREFGVAVVQYGTEIPTTQPLIRVALEYELVATFSTGLDVVRGIAIDTANRIYLAGDSMVKVLDAQGRPLRAWSTSGPARCVAVGRSGAVYVGLLTRIEKYHASGTRLASWGTEGAGPGELRYVTSIAASEPYVYVADARNRCIHRFAADGDFIQDIGKRDVDAGVKGIICPSPYLDCDVDSGGTLHVGNPGRLRVERYSPDGRFLDSWGRGGRKPEQFPGCCNPTNIAVTADGLVVVSEKGIQRVKVYDRRGELLAVVGEALFRERPPLSAAGQGEQGPSLDLAVDSRGRIHVIDPAERAVRIFAVNVGR